MKTNNFLDDLQHKSHEEKRAIIIHLMHTLRSEMKTKMIEYMFYNNLLLEYKNVKSKDIKLRTLSAVIGEFKQMAFDIHNETTR